MSNTIERFSKNPFSLTQEARAEGLTELAACSPYRVVASHLDEGKVEAAEAAIVVLTMAADVSGTSGGRALNERVWERLPRPENAYARIAAAAARAYSALERLAGESTAMNRVRAECWAASFGDSLQRVLDLEPIIIDHDVLVLGETGTGKELIAEAIQQAVPGRGTEPAPRAELNAAAIPETLIESELFGHKKGAFTGAVEARRGRLRAARGGSFFLDEVGDLRSTTQVKLLRVMETNRVSPLGSDEPEEAGCRYIAATHKDLDEMVEAGEFRRDLLQRLAGHVIRLPPLRERPEDIPAIGRAFLERYTIPKAVARRTDDWLERASRVPYPWPGNVRELQNRLRSVALGMESSFAPSDKGTEQSVPPSILAGSASMRDLNDWYLLRVLRSVDHNYAAASRVLGIDRATIRRRAQRASNEL